MLGLFSAFSTVRARLSWAPRYSTAALAARNTTKHPLSRKTFLVDYYKYLNDQNRIVLYVHHNNLIKSENQKFRSELKKAGAQLNVIRNSLYKVYLRSENEADPADAEISLKNKEVDHPIFPLLNGPTAVITVPECNPPAVAEVLKVLKAAQEKLILVGARIDSQTFDVQQIDQFKDLPSKEQLDAQLAGVLTTLAGAGLVQTLQAGPTSVYLTLNHLTCK